MKRFAIAVFSALALIAFSLVTTLGGVASADEPCKVDCEPIVIFPQPLPGELITGPVIVVPEIVSIIGPQITFEAGIPDPLPPNITTFVPDPGPPS